MRILHVHDFFAPGNSRFGFDMNRLLVDRGHSVHVLAAVGDRGPGDGAVMEGVTFHTYPHRGEGSVRSRYRYALESTGGRFEALQHELPFDLLLLNQPICARAVLRRPASRGVPKVYCFISPWAAEWRAGNPGAGPFARWLQAGVRNRLERAALKGCQAVVVESEYIRGQLREHHGEVAAPVTCLPGAVDLARFCPDGSKEAHRERFGLGAGPVVLSVRRLVERMGIDRLVRAVAQVPEATLVVGGDGPLRGELEALARSLKVRAKFLGFVPDDDLPALYRAADLFVLPTRALEGFGLVAIEAMACGTPAMGTPVGAIPDVLGPLGLVFEDDSPESMAAAIRKFFSERDEELSGKCRRYVEARFDWRAVIERVEELFLRVIGEGAGHGRG